MTRLTGDALVEEYRKWWWLTRQGKPPHIVHNGNGRYELYDRPGASPRRMKANDVRAAIKSMKESAQ